MNNPSPRPAGLPPGWQPKAHTAWLAGQKQQAIDTVLAAINPHGRHKPDALVLQLAYYVFLVGDAAAAARFLQQQWDESPGNFEVLQNLAICLSRSGQYEAAGLRAQQALQIKPDSVELLDTVCTSLHQLGRLDEARQAGTRALTLKDRQCAAPGGGWQLPAGQTPRQWLARRGGQPVVAFSLWGSADRYLHGALHNLLAARQLYPGWQMRFYLDDSVPLTWQHRLTRLGAHLVKQAPGASLRQRLAWRFAVANDPLAGWFAVRDVDSVVNARERAAVDDWLASDTWFHVMRDWWTHTDLMLAGLWGGVAGVLPPLDALLAAYQPAAAETPNVDQWFLRDRVWAYVRQSCVVHDRCFAMAGSRPWPVAAEPGSQHVGQNEYAARPAEQSALIAPWLDEPSPAALQQKGGPIG